MTITHELADAILTACDDSADEIIAIVQAVAPVPLDRAELAAVMHNHIRHAFNSQREPAA